ncbi:hypothetical protein ABTJ87_19825, partial [Acinetobacter baumannii]
MREPGFDRHALLGAPLETAQAFRPEAPNARRKRAKAGLGIVGAQPQTVFRACREHTIRLRDALEHQVID